MTGSSADSHITILGAGPYGLSAAAYLRAAGKEVRVFGQPMSFWQDQMPKGMCLRSNWGASHIADPEKKFTLDAFCRQNNLQFSKPIPIDGFVGYGQWFQKQVVPDLDRRSIHMVDPDNAGFRITLTDGERFTSKRVVVAAGIRSFQVRPPVFDRISPTLASHSSEHTDLGKFTGKSVVVIGSGQSALESAALLREAGAEIEVICRRDSLNWVGLHPRLHHLGFASKMLYSSRDVGPAGISRLVAAPHVFRRFPRWFQERTAYRAIRPAVAGWLKLRIAEVPITFGSYVVSAEVAGDRLCLKLNDGTERLVDHVLFATGYRVDVARYDFLAASLMKNLKTINGYPILKRGLESSVSGLHILGKPAAWSFGPIVGFVSGTDFASTELVRAIRAADSNGN
jgi:cation diffusion facilitator CzcD-associated flavoprotein CzcO